MQITKDKVATFEFTVTNEFGTVLDSSEQSGPYPYIHGTGYLIPGLEAQMEGKAVGDVFTVLVPPELAYGERDESLIQMVPRSQFAGMDELEVGMQLEAHYQDETRVLTVIGVDEKNVALDGNHPLAGITLNFNIKVVDVRDATPEELARGHLHGECCDDSCGCGCDDDGCQDDCCHSGH
ncbi:MAG: peptidylprolyl isomerase [Chloroflexi bacterium]|nr:peptidylprolyl isomerase [Chloroflexota bacterium]